MNLARCSRICWLGLLPLIFLFANGCSTEQSGLPKQDLTKFRTVYLVQPQDDDRNLASAILARLQRAGFDANLADIATLKQMVAARNVTKPTVVCSFQTMSTRAYDRPWYSFENAQIHFFDMASGALVFKADYFNPHSVLPENTELNRLFVQICDNFFPGEPNPFRENPKASYGPAY